MDLNKFKSGILSGAIVESRLDSKDTIDDKGDLIKTKEFSHEKCTQWEDRINKYFSQRKKIRVVPLSYVIRKYTPSPEDRENRNLQIIHQASLVRNRFKRESKKVFDILKELNLGTDAETWIRVLKCGIKSMQEL